MTPVVVEKVTLAPSTQEEIDWVEANFREGEKRERDVAGGGRTLLETFEACWTIRDAASGDVFGYFGAMVMPGESCMSRVRGLCFMSCTNVERHKIAFVRSSRPVLRYVVGKAPKWVNKFISWPIASYRGSVEWHKRVLKMREARRVPANGDEYVIFEIERKEV